MYFYGPPKYFWIIWLFSSKGFFSLKGSILLKLAFLPGVNFITLVAMIIVDLPRAITNIVLHVSSALYWHSSCSDLLARCSSTSVKPLCDCLPDFHSEFKNKHVPVMETSTIAWLCVCVCPMLPGGPIPYGGYWPRAWKIIFNYFKVGKVHCTVTLSIL